MIKGASVAVSTAALLLCVLPANAAAPVISGKYLVPVTSVCQPSLQVTYTSGAVSNIAVPSPGSTTIIMASAKFDPSAQTVSLSGVANAGSGLFLVDNIGHNFGAPFTTNPVTASYAFSGSGATVTINGVAFKAVYGKVKQGVAETFMLAGVDSGGCSVTMTGSKY